MESQKHVVVSSQLIYKVEFFEILISMCKSLLNDKVFFCFKRRNSKTRACMLEDKLEKPALISISMYLSMSHASYSKNYRVNKRKPASDFNSMYLSMSHASCSKNYRLQLTMYNIY